ncbi:hypothetical protein V8G54_004992 [Vigna mungo]|uniref:Transposase-associated domain-containing protein n=1 Tax=Vigna mungo TaxID=3915 RepID=A0AAQ3SEV6_VIGMU
MDKSWITMPRNIVEYLIGLEKFLDFAFENGASGDTIRCSYPKCGFVKWQDIVEEHLILKQFFINYVIWNLHGERQRQDISRNEDESQETFHFENPAETMINEAFGHHRQDVTNIGRSQPLGEDDFINERPRENHNEFNEFLNDGNQILCDGSKELGHLKTFVRNKAQLEGSIAEGYLAEESLTFCSRYIEDIETRNLRQADLSYYGKLEDIIELNYYGQFKVVLFKCKLIHIGNREEHEPYIKASQAQMVYYVDDVVNEGWSVTVHLKPRDLYEMGEEVQEQLYENEPYQDQELDTFYSNDNEYVQLATNHLDGDIN